jgi:hypothetical protein
MKNHIFPLLSAIATALFLSACKPPGADPDTVAEGVIWSVEYELGDGRKGGMVRSDISANLLGGSFETKADAHGRLTKDFMIITMLGKPGLGPKVIPVHRLLSVQFGDGGIKNVSQ